MKREGDLSRLTLQVPRESALGRALSAAQTRRPTEEQLHALECSVLGLIQAGAPVSASASALTPSAARPLTATGAFKLVVLVALVSV
ncbi:MAG TPA: hypothetical protein VGL59_02240, partial [Polyangia bacterium]